MRLHESAIAVARIATGKAQFDSGAVGIGEEQLPHVGVCQASALEALARRPQALFESGQVTRVQGKVIDSAS